MNNDEIHALENRLDELRMIASHFALNGIETPRELTAEWDAIQARLQSHSRRLKK
ncbi:MAG: hypothetical protein U1E65_10250 [Myxococcota bacterium]